MLTISSNKNWYLVWIAALLLLSLGKVYEWAYPGFQHDYNHYLRNELEKEIHHFSKLDIEEDKELKTILKNSKNGTHNESNQILNYLIHSKFSQVLCTNTQITYWGGANAFFKDDWCTLENEPNRSIFQYLGDYYFLIKKEIAQDSTPYQVLRYYRFESTLNAETGFDINKKKNNQPSLSIKYQSNDKIPLAYLSMDASYLAPFYGNFLILFYVFVLLLFYLPFHQIAKRFYTQDNYPWANLILISGVLITTSMCQWIVHQNEFYHSILTDKLIQTRFYNYTLFEFSIFSGIFFHITYFFYKYAHLNSGWINKRFSYLIILFNYLASIFSLVIYCFIFNAVFIHSEYYFDLNNVFSFSLQHYILLFDLLIILVAIFLITNKLTVSTHTFEINFRQRLFFFLLASIIITPIIYKSNIELSMLTFFLSASIIIWMQDFFSEEYPKNILWLISWIIVISILNSSLIFHYQNQKKRYVKSKILEKYIECDKNLKPECVSDLIQNCSTNNYDFYFFEDRLLKFSTNVYKPNYQQSLHYIKRDTFKNVIRNGQDILYARPKPNQLLIISNPLESTLKGISLFSYLFTILIIISYILSLAHQRLNFLPEGLQINFQDKPSLKNKIQFYIILGVVISFLIIAITTVFFTKRSENQIFRENLESKTKNLCTFLEASIKNAISAEDAKLILANQIRQSSQMVDFNVNFFNAEGKEEKNDAFQNAQHKIIKLLDPNFYFSYPSFAEDIVIRENSSADLDAYRNIFYNNKRIGVLQMEAIASQQYKATDRLANLINTLLNIYVFLFLIAASLATVLANSITSPLVNLGNKIRQIRLGKSNEKLEWGGQDEIGELIQNYNQMVGQLDESAQLLAKTERDMAWREMAKQVAHEIKNPLTPMKLSIQYLQQSIRSGAENINEMASKVSATLLEQIDNLTKIATEFSNFAKMPTAENEKLILNEIVSSVHDLFRKREDIDILLTVPIDELYVFADKNQIIRVLNNLINNAIQAIPETKRGRIDISLDANTRNAIICVNDNGTGIPEEMQSKVFLPNFTSKSSGTGLGLAMCQQIIESANGRIYFKTIPGTGTKFYLELPLMKQISFVEPDGDVELEN
ncbi:MAG: HAMP domain-containing histidine kinase [Saprospiraceae bacterium]|nr:HAMP domain-containing histidine kinase [Saprospiraceae bacterium]MBK9728074.1 HAMP domain-containing histidine kinase [Saprospiraceae bacterium]